MNANPTINTEIIRRAVVNAGGQKELAEACQVHQSMVSHWLTGRHAIHARHFPAIAKAGRVSQGKLMAAESENAAARHIIKAAKKADAA